MAETVPGGRYKVGDRYVNASGDELSAQALASSVRDYPHAEVLRAGGFADWASVVGATDDEILALDGIGPTRLREIRAFAG